MAYLISIFTFAVIWAIVVLSLNTLLGYGGQVSVGHAAFFGIGAYTAAILSTRYDSPFLLTLPAAMLITALIGAILGLPSLRVRHDFLVLATIGLNFIVVGTFAYVEFFGGALGIVGIPVPSIFGLKIKGAAYLALCTGFLAFTAWVSRALPKTWAGLALFALRDDELAAESVGISHARYKILAFAISGAFAGLGGALYAPFVGNVFPDRFGFFESVTLVSMLVFGGAGTVRGAVFGAIVLKSLPEYLRFGGEYRFVLYGSILLVLIVFLPQGILGEGSFIWDALESGWRRLTQRNGKDRRRRVPNAPSRHMANDAVRKNAHNSKGQVLAVEGVTVDFGGLRALDSVSLEVRTGEILGLIGPNGAGKTTLFNAIAGVVPITSGRILLNGKEIHGLAPHMSAHKGIARTFQVVRPFRSLDVEDNILTGLGVHRYRRLSAFVQSKEQVMPEAWDLASRVNLDGREDMEADQLPIGLLRRLEVGRALGTAATFVLLDEPAAGLTHEEIEELDDLVRNLASEGRGVILVEHNMRFAMTVCHRLVVLSAGKILAEGIPNEVRHNPDVITAYLGSEA